MEKHQNMEKSTVSRNLERMRKIGWIEIAAGDGGTARVVMVTPAGRRPFADLQPEADATAPKRRMCPSGP
jgi:DNA-binding MarR family transcriptional regulator